MAVGWLLAVLVVSGVVVVGRWVEVGVICHVDRWLLVVWTG